MGLGVDLAGEVRHFFYGLSVSLKAPVSESRGIRPWSLHSQGIWGKSCSFSRLLLSFSLLTEQGKWKGEWKYFSEIHHM